MSMGVHESILEQTVKLLEQSNKYKSIEKHVIYDRLGCCGEMDIVAWVTNDWALYAEIKSTHTAKAWRKAQQQFDRVHGCFPYIRWEFLYVTPEAQAYYVPPKRKKR